MSLRIDATPLKDREPLEWLRGRLVYGRAVGSWIPKGFDRYARILHPAHLWEATEGNVVARPVPWSGVSAWSGKPLHRASSIHDLARRADGTSWQDQGASLPLEGQLEPPYLDRLTDHLAEATSTPDALWLLVWDGYGGPGTPLVSTSRRLMRRRPMSRWPIGIRRRTLLTDTDPRAVVQISPSLTGRGRKYFLHQGSIEASSDHHGRSVFEEPPSFWWPADRAWFVSTDIDSSSTYVGGSSRLIDGLLTDPVLEVFPADLEDPYDGAPYDPEAREAQ